MAESAIFGTPGHIRAAPKRKMEPKEYTSAYTRPPRMGGSEGEYMARPMGSWGRAAKASPGQDAAAPKSGQAPDAEPIPALDVGGLSVLGIVILVLGLIISLALDPNHLSRHYILLSDAWVGVPPAPDTGLSAIVSSPAVMFAAIILSVLAAMLFATQIAKWRAKAAWIIMILVLLAALLLVLLWPHVTRSYNIFLAFAAFFFLVGAVAAGLATAAGWRKKSASTPVVFAGAILALLLLFCAVIYFVASASVKSGNEATAALVAAA